MKDRTTIFILPDRSASDIQNIVKARKREGHSATVFCGKKHRLMEDDSGKIHKIPPAGAALVLREKNIRGKII